jgi:hypothetical protein
MTRPRLANLWQFALRRSHRKSPRGRAVAFSPGGDAVRKSAEPSAQRTRRSRPAIAEQSRFMSTALVPCILDFPPISRLCSRASLYRARWCVNRGRLPGGTGRSMFIVP